MHFYMFLKRDSKRLGYCSEGIGARQLGSLTPVTQFHVPVVLAALGDLSLLGPPASHTRSQL